MKTLIGLMILLTAFWIGKRLYLTYETIDKNHSSNQYNQPETPSAPPSSTLPGLPPALEPSLANAVAQGAPGLRNWLQTYRSQVRDPRLAAIELDYVVLITLQDPAEARRVFQSVKARTPTFSPIYSRVKRLEQTFH